MKYLFILLLAGCAQPENTQTTQQASAALVFPSYETCDRILNEPDVEFLIQMRLDKFYLIRDTYIYLRDMNGDTLLGTEDVNLKTYCTIVVTDGHVDNVIIIPEKPSCGNGPFQNPCPPPPPPCYGCGM